MKYPVLSQSHFRALSLFHAVKSAWVYVCFIALSVISVSAHALYPTVVYQENFQGFTFSSSTTANISNEPLRFAGKGQTEVTISTCQQLKPQMPSEIADYEYSRYFRAVTTCAAIEKLAEAKPAVTRPMGQLLDMNWLESLPAKAIPYPKTDHINNALTIAHQLKFKQVKLSASNNYELITEHDRIYLTPLARADFTHDGNEDILLQTEWYPQDAFGKYVDLLIISKAHEKAMPVITWRLVKPDLTKQEQI
ncbi:hypothetical protein A3K86_04865 [Photobacterium jeanii]|uniref:Uncharacterized protein n=1 Tax=Photobacterium jeanii TaxID=858640 RepID=A0A178KNU0_9GAMM|nr:hypothetical protein [Photobacterium jeanii]OAN18232.1 hypothetical protein A3K86_04865 [Photobacterium jeanii]PST92091.1 hypothetical protein C9I91_02610 [Photobacterium jeanii]